MQRKRLYISGLVLTVAIGLFFVFGSETAFAQVVEETATTDFGLAEFDEATTLSSTNIIIIITRIIRILLGLLGIVVLSLFLYAGYNWMTSAGDESKIETAKKTMINATIGLVIIFSAFTIVTFVINALVGDNEVQRGDNSGGTPAIVSFTGSGSLGNIIQDHYPLRGERGVARNTQITVTFGDTFDPASFITETNGTDVLGDCVPPTGDDTFDWAVHCDQLNTEAIIIYKHEDSEVAERPVVAAAAMVAYTDSTNEEAFSVSLRPIEALGSSVERMWYTVELTNNILNAQGDGMFDNSRSRYYEWDFEADTTFDFGPPVVQSIYPREGRSIAKNEIIQITFSEPVSPVMVQGVINSGASPFTNIVFDTESMVGTWRISNGYRTVEFIPESPCGEVNACGEVMYCLETESGVTQPYDLLIRTAQLLEPDSWQAFPFTGVVDMAMNAFDGNADGVRDNRPTPLGGTAILETEKGPDNFDTSFEVRDEIDRRIPYVHEISPGVDQHSVRGDIPLTLHFNMPTFSYTLSGITLTEYPTPDEVPEVDDNIWYRSNNDLRELPADVFGEDAVGTKVRLDHREFGPNGADVFYYTTVGAGVRSSNQNCLYPGRGPGYTDGDANTLCTVNQAEGVVTDAPDCTVVSPSSATDAGCAYNGGNSAASTDACEAEIQADIDLILE